MEFKTCTRYLLITVGFLFFAFQFSLAQKAPVLLLKKGTLELKENIYEKALSPIPNEQIINDHYYRIVQFDHVLLQEERRSLEAKGLKILDYIPHFAYVLSIPVQFNPIELLPFGGRSMLDYDASIRCAQGLDDKPYPAHVMLGDRIAILFKVQKDLESLTVFNDLIRAGIEVLDVNSDQGSGTVLLTEQQLQKFRNAPFIAYMELSPEPGEPEDVLGQSLHRSNTINRAYAGGIKFDGTGVSIAINDDGFVGPHIDFTGRTDQSDVAGDFVGDHGDMTTGIAGGAGNIDPTIQGMAPGAFIWVRQYASSLPNTLTLHQNNGVMVFSSSYSNGCNGGYTTTTQNVDQEIYDNTSLIQSFSAGNSNNNDCGYGAGNQWGNITGGHKIAKNVIAAANLLSDETLVGSSSRGPASDGRIKPDIASNGNGQLSTDPNNNYAPGGGTSAACPGITGILAQLYQAYREMNGGSDPESGLLKAAMLNTAHDLGNVGPDFKYGWGRVNAWMAYDILANNKYTSGGITQGATNQHIINVPVGVDELRVMVYWMDPPASTVAFKALVNDLDMTVTDPGNTVNQPWILNPTPDPALLDLPAVPGIDTLNNVEQVVFTNPASGNYTVNIAGTEVPQGPQNYYVVWQFFGGVTVTYPVGGEGFVPGETERIHWDAIGNTGNFDIEYSTDGGSTWNMIANVSGTTRFYNWTVPSTVTGQARIRITRGADSDTSDVDFTIIALAQNLQTVQVCPNYMRISWDAVTGATGYIVHQLGAMYMDSIDNTALTQYDVPIPNPTTEQWWAITAIGPNGIRSRRTIAQQFDGSGLLNCTQDHDMALGQIIAPSGTLQDCYSLDVDVEVQLFNSGLFDESNFPIKYQLNGGTIVSEVYSLTLATGASANFTFSTLLTLPGAGSHTLVVWTELPADAASFNDTLMTTINVVSSSSASIPFSDDLESYSLCSTATDCGTTTCALGNGWVQPANGDGDDVDWRIDENGTSSIDTGPSQDADPGTATGNYLYLETSGTCNGQEGHLISPCFDLSGLSVPTFQFAYHMYGATMGSLHVDLFDGSSWTNDISPSISGDQGDVWNNWTIDLSAWSGQTISIRIRGITGTSFTSDMAIDAFGLYDAAAPPVVEFSADKITGCIGDTIIFTDASLNFPTAWTWTITPNTYTFVNGTNSNSQDPQVSFSAAGLYTVELNAVNGFGNNALVKTDYIDIVEGELVTVFIVTDRWGNETTWEIIGSNGIVASGGPYINTGVNGEFPQAPVSFCLDPNQCYDFAIHDSFGDGMCCAYGNGSYTLTDSNGDTLVSGGPGWLSDSTTNFCLYPEVRIDLKVFLEGPYNVGASAMNDDLRVAGFLPSTEPFTALGFTHAGMGGGETLGQAILSVSGLNAIVDWVLVELRSASDNTLIVATRSALVQRDGDVVNSDGGPLTVRADAGMYYIAVRHRNHLGCMVNSTYLLNDSPTLIDLTNSSISTWGTNALRSNAGVDMLWAGNVVEDGLLKYTGTNNDRDPILIAIGGAVPTASVSGYFSEDVNMDGIVKYTGSVNDRDPILTNIGGVVPTSIRMEQLPQ